MADRRFPRWARWTALGCGVAVVGASTYLVVDALPSEAATGGLRTATVATGSVTQSISLSGSVQRVDQVSATFRTSGTVRTVTVAVGDEVEAGDELATMDTDDLERAVTVAQANLVAAQASLDAAAADTGSTSASTSSARATVPSVTPSPSPSPSPSPRTSSVPSPRVDTTPVHRAVTDADALVKAAVTACQPLLDGGTPPTPPPTPSPSPTATPSASTTPTVSPSPTPTTEPSPTPSPGPTTEPPTPEPPTPESPTPAQVSACIRALSSALGAAQHTASAMDGLTKALDAATRALQQQQSNAATRGTTPQTSVTGAASGTGAGTGAGTGTAPAGGSGGARSTADLEVAVLEATQQLAGAEQDLDGAVLAAPISGRVGRVDLREGEQASTSSAVVLVGAGAAVVTVDLPLAQLSKVRVAQDVSVTPAGTTEQVPGLVRSIGVLPSSTTTSTPAYPLQVTVSDAPVTLAAGSNATTTITLATVTDVLTVPVSAVTGVSSGAGSVRVLAAGSTSTAAITVGAVGQGRVQVEKGLTAGQVVVLADPDTALPSSTGFRRPTTGGVSGLTGRGGPGGGLGGPPPG